SCQRLANGNTFMLDGHTAAEVTPKGQKVYSRSLFDDKHERKCCSRRLHNGHVLCTDPAEKALEYLVEVDPASGREVRRIRLPKKLDEYAQPGVAEVSGGHHYLMQTDSTHTQEFDASGKVLWQYKGPPVHLRLRNGNTVGCADVCYPTVERFIEVDPAG